MGRDLSFLAALLVSSGIWLPLFHLWIFNFLGCYFYWVYSLSLGQIALTVELTFSSPCDSHAVISSPLCPPAASKVVFSSIHFDSLEDVSSPLCPHIAKKVVFSSIHFDSFEDVSSPLCPPAASKVVFSSIHFDSLEDVSSPLCPHTAKKVVFSSIHFDSLEDVSSPLCPPAASKVVFSSIHFDSLEDVSSPLCPHTAKKVVFSSIHFDSLEDVSSPLLQQVRWFSLQCILFLLRTSLDFAFRGLSSPLINQYRRRPSALLLLLPRNCSTLVLSSLVGPSLPSASPCTSRDPTSLETCLSPYHHHFYLLGDKFVYLIYIYFNRFTPISI
ncbi:hypothetical protein TNCT_606941 [Trichonephila clavata]|uniref:Uncharacterized protein n=1 Tax=Trichonephila clavata TaxID=2740835 RepID=A0A8X6F9Q5_TRICU|nr:hypothetical protein TNCT_606941 [Trichonephila clavata]